jgi:hypothetical protein
LIVVFNRLLWTFEGIFVTPESLCTLRVFSFCEISEKCPPHLRQRRGQPLHQGVHPLLQTLGGNKIQQQSSAATKIAQKNTNTTINPAANAADTLRVGQQWTLKSPLHVHAG